MSTSTISCAIAPISISSTTIRVVDGLFSLNDLHQASGGEKRHQPSNWLDTQQTQDLIAELAKDYDPGMSVSSAQDDPGIPGTSEANEKSLEISVIPLAIKTVRGKGKAQGTYACKELVYAYGMWISPRFHLQVIRAFDAMRQAPALPALITVAQAGELSALIAEGLLVINSQDQMRGNRKVTAYDLADGRKHYEIGINGWGQVMQVQGDVLMVPSQNSLDCYELTTGKLKWRAAVGSMPTLVAVDDERVVIVEPVIDRNAGRNKVRFASWSVQTGKRLWSSEEFSGYYQAAVGRSPYGASAPVVPKGTAKLAVSIYDHQARRPTVLALDGASGKLLWRSDLPLNTQPPALVAGAAHVAGSLQLGGGAASEVRVWALDSGKLLYSQPMGRVGQLSVQQDLLLYVGGNGEIERLKPGEAKPDQPAPGPAVPEPPRPQVPAPAPVSAPAPAPAPVGK